MKIEQNVEYVQYLHKILYCDHSNESYWAVLSCGTVYYAVQGGSNFWVCDEILKCDHSNESYWAVLSCGTVYNAVQCGSNFWVWLKSWIVTIQGKAFFQYFPVVLSIMVYKVVLTFWACGWNDSVFWMFILIGAKIASKTLTIINSTTGKNCSWVAFIWIVRP